MTAPNTLILNVNPEGKLGDTLRGLLESEGIRVHTHQAAVREDDPAQGACGASLENISLLSPQLIFLVLPTNLLGRAGELLKLLKKYSGDAPVVLVIAGGKPEEIYASLKSGFNDYFTGSLNPTDIYPRIWRLLEMSNRAEALKPEFKEQLELRHLIGKNKAFVAGINKIPTIAKYDSSVLILGETGTGKEVCARAIHHLSPRAGKPFVPVNCAAIPLDLIENELFGHERGAFTGAYLPQSGLVREADGGTILLDEIDSLPLLAQVKLLRFIQDKEYRPLGSAKKHEANIRVIAATNVDLEQEIAKGRFRQDLYYRINVVQMTLPPLRERREDIPLLARHFLRQYAAKFKVQVDDFSPEALSKLMCYDWPGNVRELEHLVERSVITSEHRVIRSDDLSLHNHGAESVRKSFHEAKSKVIEQFERDYIEKVLIDSCGNITKAALVANKNRRSFFELIRKHHIDVHSLRGLREDSGM
jgi:two-component system, NtrC family, response regulator GlrR